MSCTYAWHDGSAVKTFTGYVTGEDFILSAEKVGAHRDFDGLKVIYNNFLDIVGHGIDVQAYARVAVCRRGAERTNPNYRVTFIATGHCATSLLAAIDPSDHSARYFPVVFSTMADAEAWLLAQPVFSDPRPRYERAAR